MIMNKIIISHSVFIDIIENRHKIKNDFIKTLNEIKDECKGKDLASPALVYSEMNYKKYCRDMNCSPQKLDDSMFFIASTTGFQSGVWTNKPVEVKEIYKDSLRAYKVKDESLYEMFCTLLGLKEKPSEENNSFCFLVSKNDDLSLMTNISNILKEHDFINKVRPMNVYSSKIFVL